MKEKPSKEFIRQRRIVVAVVALVILIPTLVYDLSGIGGNIKFYAKWLECGRKPLSPGVAYKKPKHYIESDAVNPMRLTDRFFCTPLEAERAGYSARDDTWYFPELDAIGEMPPDRV